MKAKLALVLGLLMALTLLAACGGASGAIHGEGDFEVTEENLVAQPGAVICFDSEMTLTDGDDTEIKVTEGSAITAQSPITLTLETGKIEGKFKLGMCKTVAAAQPTIDPAAQPPATAQPPAAAPTEDFVVCVPMDASGNPEVGQQTIADLQAQGRQILFDCTVTPLTTTHEGLWTKDHKYLAAKGNTPNTEIDLTVNAFAGWLR